jgi:hypothetical protein
MQLDFVEFEIIECLLFNEQLRWVLKNELYQSLRACSENFTSTIVVVKSDFANPRICLHDLQPQQSEVYVHIHATQWRASWAAASPAHGFRCRDSISTSMLHAAA